MVFSSLAMRSSRSNGLTALRSVSRSATASSSSSGSSASSSNSSASSSRTTVSNARSMSSSSMRRADAAPKAASSPASSKLTTIVDQIEKLTLLEAADLVAQLKERLNITEIAMPSAGAAAPAAAPVVEAAAEEADKPKEKTIFTVTLKGLKDPTAKAKVIKEIKALNSTMNLVEAKKFVESAPQVLKEGLTKEDAEKLSKAIETAGGLVETD